MCSGAGARTRWLNPSDRNAMPLSPPSVFLTPVAGCCQRSSLPRCHPRAAPSPLLNSALRSASYCTSPPRTVAPGSLFCPPCTPISRADPQRTSPTPRLPPRPPLTPPLLRAWLRAWAQADASGAKTPGIIETLPALQSSASFAPDCLVSKAIDSAGFCFSHSLISCDSGASSAGIASCRHRPKASTLTRSRAGMALRDLPARVHASSFFR